MEVSWAPKETLANRRGLRAALFRTSQGNREEATLTEKPIQRGCPLKCPLHSEPHIALGPTQHLKSYPVIILIF